MDAKYKIGDRVKINGLYNATVFGIVDFEYIDEMLDVPSDNIDIWDYFDTEWFHKPLYILLEDAGQQQDFNEMKFIQNEILKKNYSDDVITYKCEIYSETINSYYKYEIEDLLSYASQESLPKEHL